MARRVVGFLEYGNALDYLDRLASMSDKEDLAAIDSIIADHEEFAIFRELPRGFEINGERKTLDRPSGLPGAKQGLAWLIGLARLEFGAIVSGYTDHPKPYQYVQPDRYAYAETMQLLLEGVDSHYSALQQTDLFQERFRRADDVRVALTLSRRLRIARAMLQPIMATERSLYSSQQASQLEKAAFDLDKAQARINNGIRAWLASTQQSSRSTDGFRREFVNACGQMLAAERQEIQAATATPQKASESKSDK